MRTTKDEASITPRDNDTSRAAGEAQAGATAGPRVCRRVLFADDDPDFLQLLRAELNGQPYDLITVTSACSALDILRKEIVDVIVADEVMTDMSGTDLLSVVAREFPSCSRILLTGHATVEIVARAVNKAGISGFLLKPCDPALLCGAIKKAVGASSLLVDPATGLLTRLALEQAFDMQRHACGGLCAVIHMDIDCLHVINQVHGFAGGDAVIRQVANLLAQAWLPKGALRARVCGDRFAMILPGCGLNAARALSRRFQTESARIAVGSPPRLADVSISFGIAMIRDGGKALANALAEAELACRGAKDLGRNRVEQYDTNDTNLMRRQGEVIAAGLLRETLRTDGFLLYAQPIVSLADTSAVFGYELLLRMRDRDGVIVSASQIISAAERYHLMPTIDRWVVQHAMRELASCRTLLGQRSLCMSINISGQSIGDPEFLEFLARELSQSRLAPRNVMLEITEHTAIATDGCAADRLRKICRRGWRLALDDFGTGTNSLSNLKRLPVARIKIDGSFVRDVLTSRRSVATIQAIVQLAKGAGVDTVAEFVETPAVAQRLHALGVRYGQGYAFGTPAPLDLVLDGARKARDRVLRYAPADLESHGRPPPQ